MFQIAMVVCSILQGAACREVELTFVDNEPTIMPYACMVMGQVEIAKWMELHPNTYVSRWTCRKAGLFART